MSKAQQFILDQDETTKEETIKLLHSLEMFGFKEQDVDSDDGEFRVVFSHKKNECITVQIMIQDDSETFNKAIDNYLVE